MRLATVNDFVRLQTIAGYPHDDARVCALHDALARGATLTVERRYPAADGYILATFTLDTGERFTESELDELHLVLRGTWFLSSKTAWQSGVEILSTYAI